jgi:hypothetical protein
MGAIHKEPPWFVDVLAMDFDDLKAGMKNNDIVQCPDCHAYLKWKGIPNENIIQGTEHEEFWGAPCSYQTVEGYICPECTAKIDF